MMHPIRQRKMFMLVGMVFALALVAALIMYALRQNISLFYTPSQLMAGDAIGKHQVRVGGMVVKGSIVRSANDLTVQFKLTDFNQTVVVNYRGILPDLFREGQGIVASGFMVDKQHFQATEVLAKHDANYMPPEVKQALAQHKATSEDPAAVANEVAQSSTDFCSKIGLNCFASARNDGIKKLSSGGAG